MRGPSFSTTGSSNLLRRGPAEDGPSAEATVPSGTVDSKAAFVEVNNSTSTAGSNVDAPTAQATATREREDSSDEGDIVSCCVLLTITGCRCPCG
mmetsp:Transcript_5121/g.8867  ORF Transcript_5121/g.8867 Transcript_5121/m.8867 type:complete len:95 (+) Transcript_5121:230-514(+)